MLLASTSFATMSALIKGAGTGIPLAELVFLRCLLSIPILLLIIRVRKRPLMVQAKKTILLRSACGMTAMFGFFYALTHMPLADCIFIGRSQPLILSLLAPLLINEKTPRSAWVAIFTGIVGVFLIMRPGASWSLAAFAALGAAFFSALAHIMVRRLNATDFPLVIVFNFTVVTALATGIWIIPRFVMPSAGLWPFIIGIALFASLGQMFMTLAYQRDRAPVVASSSYASVVLAVLYGYFFWGEIPGPTAWLGGGLIIFGGILLLKNRLRINEPPSPAAT